MKQQAGAIFSDFINLMLKSKGGILAASQADNMSVPDLRHFILTAHRSEGGLPLLSFYNQLTGPWRPAPRVSIVCYSRTACGEPSLSWRGEMLMTETRGGLRKNSEYLGGQTFSPYKPDV